MRALLAPLLLVLLAAPASAGSRDAPEVSDPAGDCAFAPGNEYADIIAAWISEETGSDFLVNLALGKWTQDMLGSYAGYTLQFTHQGVQWGVAALYDPRDGWSWSTAFIDTQSGEMGNFSDTTGSWDPATATMSILFPKSLFPHEGDDDQLSSFLGGTADFKKDLPVFIAQAMGAPVEPVGGFLGCDLVESSATYTFTVGTHAAHGATSGPAPSEVEPATEEATATPTAAAPAPATGQDVPLPPLGVALMVLACLAAFRRGSRRL